MRNSLCGPWVSTMLLYVALLAGATMTVAQSPSFVLFFSDDQRWDTMGWVNPVLQTPNLDVLAREGVYFPNAFVTTSICPASRVTVLTGLHERTHRYSFYTSSMQASLSAASYPALLRAAGYLTAMVGKSGVVFAGPVEEMFDVFVPLQRQPSYFREQLDGSLRHLTDITGDHVEAFLASLDSDQPFSLWVTFNAPHALYSQVDGVTEQYFEWPERFDELYEDVEFPIPPTHFPEFLDTQPEFLRDTENVVRGEVLWNFERYQKNMRGYHRMIAGVDDVVGRIRQMLEDYGRTDTVIVFLSDNGYFVGERGGYSGKWLPHEPSIRVPMMVYDPRTAPSLGGMVQKEMVLNIDIPLTLLDLAGVDVPEQMQGRSLVPLLLESDQVLGWRDDIFVEHLMDPNSNDFHIPRHEGIRTANGWKYALYPDYGYEELYWLGADPWEEENLANDPTYEDKLILLRSRTVEFRRLYSGEMFIDGFESGDVSAWGQD